MVTTPLDPGRDYRAVSRKLFTVRWIIAVCFWLVLLIALAVAGFIARPEPLAYYAPLLGLPILGFLIHLRIVSRQVNHLGYAMDDIALRLCRGIMFRRIDVVPYGRIQTVDVQSGPLLRRFGLAKVTLHTASMETDAVITGLPTAEADEVRERLLHLGVAEMEGV